MVIAVISDTHLPRGARRLPDACVERIAAADLLLHAGDFSTLEVLRATSSGGIQLLGSIEHGDIVQGTDLRHYSSWQPTVRRGVMMDDFVYSISYGGMKVHDVRDLSRPVTTVVFP